MNDGNHQKVRENTARIFFLLFCIAFFLGIAPGSLGAELGVYMSTFIVLILTLILRVGSIRAIIILWGCILGGLFGLFSYSEGVLDESIFREKIYQQKRNFHVEGTVNFLAYTSDFRNTYSVKIDNFATWSGGLVKGSHINFDIFVEVPSNLKIYPGESIKFDGKIEEISASGDGGFKKYTFGKGIYGKMRITKFERKVPKNTKVITKIQEKAKQAVLRGFPREEAGVILGMILGNIELLKKDIKDQFLLSGTTHILVVSGSNIAFVLLIMSTIFRYIGIGQLIKITTTVLAVIGYSSLVGWETPVIRATLMGVISFLAIEYGKRISSVAIILCIGVCLILYNPFFLIYDPGFGLSFGATIGIILYQNMFENILIRAKIPKILSSLLAVTCSASIGSFPAIIYHFGSIATGSILSNILITFAVGCIMILGTAYIVSALLGGYFLYALGYLVYLPTTYILKITEIFSKYPMLSIPEGWRTPISLIIIGYISASIIEREVGAMKYQKGREP